MSPNDPKPEVALPRQEVPSQDAPAYHPAVLRLLHWANVPTLAIMLWSGLLIYWAYKPYRIVVFGYEVFYFFPKSWFKALGATRQLAKGLAWHFSLMWAFTLIGLGYTLWLFASGYWRRTVPAWRDWTVAPREALQDIGILKGHPEHRPYNSPQKITYFLVLVAGWVMGLSGWAIYKPVQLWWLTAAMGGYEAARLEHFVGWLFLIFFILLHVIQVIREGWRNFMGMIKGK